MASLVGRLGSRTFRLSNIAVVNALPDRSTFPCPNRHVSFNLPDNRLTVGRDFTAQARAFLGLKVDDVEFVLVKFGRAHNARPVRHFHLEWIPRLGDVEPGAVGRAIWRDMRNSP